MNSRLLRLIAAVALIVATPSVALAAGADPTTARPTAVDTPSPDLTATPDPLPDAATPDPLPDAPEAAVEDAAPSLAAAPGEAPAGGVADEEVQLSGEVVRLALELRDGTAVEAVAVVTEDGDAVRVASAELEGVPTGAQVDVTTTAASVVADGDDLVTAEGGAEVADVDVVSDDVAPFLAELAGPAQRPVRSVHATLPGQGASGVAVGTLSALVTSSVRPYWWDSTGGAIQFFADGELPSAAYGGWGTASTCTTTQILGFLAWAEARSGAAALGNARHVVVHTPQWSACGFAGVAHVANGGVAWLNGSGSSTTPSWTVLAHELGHTLTLGHSNARTSCSGDYSWSACRNGEYGDAYDVMGWSSGGTGPISGAHLDTLGLLTSASTVVASGNMTTTLAPVGGLTGRRFLVVVTGGARYYVEYRGATGRDADLATSRRGCPLGVSGCVATTRYVPGVVVHRIDGATESGVDAYLLPAGGSSFVLQAGEWWVTPDTAFALNVESIGSSGATVRLVGGAEAPLAVTSNGNPVGSFEFVTASPGNVRVRGWAVDPSTTAPVYVWVDVAGAGRHVYANTSRPDVAAAIPGYGDAHGFDATIPAGRAGPVSVCMTVVNVGVGANQSLGCRTVTVPDASPVGRIDSATATVGSVRLRGWALDPETTAPTYLWVDVAGKGRLAVANATRADIGQAFGLGDNHGIDLTMPVDASGRVSVCVTVINQGSGGNTSLGCTSVVVPDASPVGRVDSVSAVAGAVRVRGWALDPETSVSSYVVVSVAGREQLVFAGRPRADIGAAFGLGDAHGFDVTMAVGVSGPVSACVTAVNSGAGRHSSLGCTTVVVPDASPVGRIDSVTASPGQVRLRGWALDPETTAPIYLWVDVAGSGRLARAAAPRADIGSVFGLGDAHGFDLTYPASAGATPLCVTAVNTGSGQNTYLGCLTAVVAPG